MNYIGLDKEKRRSVAGSLNQILANYHIYYQKLRNFHWNIKGENFFDLHIKFEELYTDARDKIDDIAERIRALEETPVSLLKEYLKMSEIEEKEGTFTDHEMVNEILEDHKVLISNYRDVLKNADSANDEGTIDMMGGFLRHLEKNTWMLAAWANRTGNPKQKIRHVDQEETALL